MALVATFVFEKCSTVIYARLLVLPRYGSMGASSRMRFYQYLPFLERSGIKAEVHPLFDDAALSKRYSSGAYGYRSVIKSFASRVENLRRRKGFDLLWIEKEALPWMPLCIESALLQGVDYVIDFDDAVFHNYDQHRLGWVRHFYGKRLDALMAKATLVVGGNDYLANRAKEAGAPWVKVIPTVIDLERYPNAYISAPVGDGLPRIVWIGSPSTVHYLEILREPLQTLALRIPFVLRLIGASVDLPGVNVECVQWTEATEVASIAGATVGIMPLLDSPWERGKCGYKLIQYMACGLPAVASPVGVNSEIVQDGISGFLAVKTDEWVMSLERLLTNPDLCYRMGKEGRRRVESTYCLQVTGPRMVELLKLAERRKNRCAGSRDF